MNTVLHLPVDIVTLTLDVPFVKMKLIEIVKLVTIHMFSLNLLAYNVLTVNLTKDTSVIIKIMNVTNVTTTV
jgi:hypothetical protein